MPCDSGVPSSGEIARDDIQKLRQEFERLTRVSCDLAGCIEKMGMFDTLNPETQQWVRQHQEVDRLRAEREAQKSAHKRVFDWCDACDGTGLMEGWNRRDGNSCPKCKGAGE